MVQYNGMPFYTTRELADEYNRPQTTICRALRTLDIKTTTVPWKEIHPEKGAGGALKLIDEEGKRALDKWARGVYMMCKNRAAIYIGCSSMRLEMYSGEGKIPCYTSGRGNPVWARDDLDKIRASGLMQGVNTDWDSVVALFQNGVD